ncbi:hypothetical protein AAE478_004429 [Parahypoxylon ruwenzoriense]
MFRILTASKDPENPFEFKIADPPFERNKVSRRSNFACDRCRTKKLRCTRENSGCQRCLASKIPCKYTRSIKASNRHNEAAPPVSSLNINTSSSLSTRLSPAGADEQPPSTDATTQGTIGEQCQYDSEIQEPPELFQQADICSPVEDDFLALLNFENPWPDPHDQLRQPESIFDASIFLEGKASMVEPLRHRPSTLEASQTGGLFSREFNFAGEKCRCVELLLKIQEQLTIRMDGHGNVNTRIRHLGGWGADRFKEPLQIYQILNFYKAAFRHCLGILQCKPCQSQSAIIMLLITICDQMVDELVLLPQALAEMAQLAPRMGNGNLGGSQGASKGSDIDHEFGRNPIDAGGTSGGWYDLDRDDHRLVLRALTAQRLKMLDHLIQGLASLVQQRCWKHHLTRLEAINNRLTSYSIT